MKKNLLKYISLILVILMCTSSLFSCGKKAESADTAPETTETADAENTATALADSAGDASPVRGTESGADTVITLLEGTASVAGEGAASDGLCVTVSSAGSYEITGEAEGAKIIVDTSDEETVKLILNGAGIYSSESCAIQVNSAPKKVNIQLQEGSVNVVTDASERTDGDETEAAIWSSDDLKLSGSGTLYVTGSCKRGIFTKDDLEITGGIIYISAADEGIRGRDSVEISGGTLAVISGSDGIRTDETEKDGKGNLIVSGGEISVTSGGDGLYSVKDLTISGGSIVISAGGGSANAAPKQSNDRGMGGGFGGRGQQSASFQTQSADTAQSSDSTVSTKGIKADGAITVSGGSVTADSADDSLHSGTSVQITDGVLALASGDDGIHADSALEVIGGSVTVSASYEGYEAQTISISGGSSSVTASDDGVNASGSGTPLFSVSDGYLFVNAGGDGLDSNGNIEISGGTVVVAGPTDNSNAPLDSGDNNNYIAVTGGTLIAYGSSGMAEYPTESKTTQYSIGTTLSATAGTLVYITDTDGNAIAAFSVEKASECLCFSSPDIENGKSYKIYTGGSCTGEATNGVYTGGTCTGGSESCEITISSTVTTYGSAGMGFGGMGGGGAFGGKRQ